FATNPSRWAHDANGNVRIRVNTDGLADTHWVWVDNDDLTFDRSRHEWIAAVDAAIATWNKVAASNGTRVFFVTVPDSAEISFKMANLGQPTAPKPPAPTFTRLKTRCNGPICTDELESAEITINTQEPWAIQPDSTNEKTLDMQTAMFHEFGHAIGLD